MHVETYRTHISHIFGLCGLIVILLLQILPSNAHLRNFNRDTEHVLRRAERAATEEHIKSRRQCVHSSRERRSGDRYSRTPRYATTGRGNSVYGMALYFTGQNDLLRRAVKNHLTTVGYPTEQFTVELWVKPEGGQKSPAIIVGFTDTCHSQDREIGWSLGIKGPDNNPNSDARFFFSLHTDRSRQATLITSHRGYQPNTWVHLAGTYNGRRMKLYVNGAMVASSSGQGGPIFNAVTQQCKQLVLGGSLLRDAAYRGAIDELIIWSESRSHADIKSSMTSYRVRNSGHPNNIILEDFDFMSDDERAREWEDIGDTSPVIVTSDIPDEMHDLSLHIPPCGVTICDNPTVMQSYMTRETLRKSKILRYRFVTIANDDGSMPTVTHENILRQHHEINDAFAPHNITWELSEMVVRNSSLRRRIVLHSCHVSDIGNSRCNEECLHEVTGNDGGDCEVETDCSGRDNGRCDMECNKAYHDWDDGDCCDPFITDTNVTCFDPNSAYRSYMSVEELKHTVNSESDTHLTVFFVKFDDPMVEGFATLPWETEALGVLGGSVLHADCCNEPGSADSIIHELGHNLGLWHVHEGVTGMDCSDECWEKEASLELGDMIADTNPTPENYKCRDPQPCDNYATCGFEDEEYVDTPFRNYMSYTDHECTDHFTFQQSARMHCYIDLFYPSWRSDNSPTYSIPLKPYIISEKQRLNIHELAITWVPPLNGLIGDSRATLANGGFACGDCTEGDVLAQYASTAMASGTKTDYLFKVPERATGMPDAPRCKVSKFAWYADDGGSCANCILELGFTTPVIPNRLSVWINWIDEPLSGSDVRYEIRDIELVSATGAIVSSLGPKEVFCDMPFTTLVPGINEAVNRVRIHVTKYLSIDAVLLESRPQNTDCQSCVHPLYNVHRDPAFDNGDEMVEVKHPYFVDSSVTSDVDYTYTVIAVIADNEESDPSPPLHFRLGQSFCGNGVIDSANGEECDDGNVMDGDGCNTVCLVETHFKCSGKPSLCYKFIDDGICESFERHLSVEDCGYHTPPGFRDQWASNARANPDYQSKRCPATVVKGDPGRTQVCYASVEQYENHPRNRYPWYPCRYEQLRTDYWLRVSFTDPVVATSVIIHLGADGFYQYSDPKRVSVSLIGPDGVSHTQPAEDVAVSCRENPVHFNIVHDLSKPFYYTQQVHIEINSFEVAISAVRLRSWKAFDPVEIGQCSGDHIYDPTTEQCVDYSCKKPRCGQLSARKAHTNCTGRNEGDLCRVTCLPGYTPQETRTLQCISGEWTGPDDVICRSIDCGNPNIPYAKFNCPSGTKFGRECTFKCISPAKLQGTNNRVVCQEDGLFSLPDSFCQLMCESPPDVANAELQTTSCLRAGQYIVGTSCKYECTEGYHVAGEAQKKRTLRYKCGIDSQWDGPQCLPVVCSAPPPVFTGLYNCTDSYNFNSICRLQCPTQAHNDQLITCQADGTWDHEFTMCPSFVGECQPPVSPDHTVLFSCDSTTAIGSICTVSCRRRYPYSHLVVLNGANIKYAKSAAEWKERIICTGQRQWYPDPSRLACADDCEQMSIKDNFCDGMNNRAYCEWDGGDCCSSTCPFCYGDESLPSFLQCADGECDCLDPDAEENILG
ncbi:pappalysin-1-like [Amphiura filiformis]|uniref:pappalysin-1-like n=1 Tax=Amphiura filiformis TaxID=82378 RepID=UPI003B2279B0